jgi:hypothetical protein
VTVHRWLRRGATLVLLVGIVLSPLRAAAATIPMLIAYDAAVGPTTTIRTGAGPSVRPARRGAREYIYDGGLNGYGGTANSPTFGDAVAIHAYDDTLNVADRREVGEGVSYAAAAATTPAEGVSVGGQAWRAFQPGEEACLRACVDVANAIQKTIGGEIKTITSPVPGGVLC